MKKCSYCGRENSDDAAHCVECGTEFAAASVKTLPAGPRDETWVAWLVQMLRFAGTILFIGFLYLLSFGPVERYCCTRTVVTSAPPSLLSASNSAPSSTVISAVSMRYPAWVSVVYRPVFMMLSGDGGNGLYGRYLQWWEGAPDQ